MRRPPRVFGNGRGRVAGDAARDAEDLPLREGRVAMLAVDGEQAVGQCRLAHPAAAQQAAQARQPEIAGPLPQEQLGFGTDSGADERPTRPWRQPLAVARGALETLVQPGVEILNDQDVAGPLASPGV